jgi:hypothetical protein
MLDLPVSVFVMLRCRSGAVTSMSTRSIVLDEIRTVAAEQDKSLPPLTDDLGLLDSGLDSLCLAILVSRLEDITGNDPFQSATRSTFPRTIGDLIALYETVRA